MDYLRNWGNQILSAIPDIVAAVVILVLALVVAWLAKLVVSKILKATKLDAKLNKLEIEQKKGSSTSDYIGRLVFIIVFILFLPSVFARLGLTGVAEPISQMVTAIVAFIPNLLAAALILFIGFFVAKIIRDLLTPLLRKIGLDRFQNPKAKADAVPDPERSSIRLSTVVANIVYVLILIPIVIAALEVLKIAAISTPAIAMLNQIFTFIPQIILAIVLIALGAFIARFVGNLLTSLLESVGADQWLRDVMPTNTPTIKLSVSKTLGKIVQFVILLFFIVEGLNIIQLQILQTIGSAIIAYLPNALVAVLILLAAIFFANWVEGLIHLRLRNSRGVAALAKTAILALALFVVFDQLKIADETINVAFRYAMMGLAVAFALAFGLGGRDFAKHTLQKLSERADEVARDFRETEDANLDDEIRQNEARAHEDSPFRSETPFTTEPPSATPDLDNEDPLSPIDGI